MITRCASFLSVVEITMKVLQTECLDRTAESLVNWAERKQLRQENQHLRFQNRMLRAHNEALHNQLLRAKKIIQ